MLSATARTWREDRLEKILAHEAQEKRQDFIDDNKINSVLEETKNPAPEKIRNILAKAKTCVGLTPKEAAVLLNTTQSELWEEIYAVAHHIKQEIYGNRIVLFAPLYISSACVNNCVYCGFRESNTDVKEERLTMEQLEKEVQALVSKGHKRLIVVYGEHPDSDVDFMCQSIEKIYATKNGRGEIRRVNVNAAPLFVDEYRQLKEVGIGTFQVFQETYHHATYDRMHPRNTLKNSFTWRLFSLHRAQEAGIDDVAIGALFGLYDWRFEVLGLLYHAYDLEREFGVGPHTISFPRLQPAENTPYATNSSYLVSDENLKQLVAVLRCAVPYTGLILTARERPKVRREVIPVGISQIDAGSRIAIGGYEQMEQEHIPDREQFQLGDTRSLDKCVQELCTDGYIPSFCTAGYRCGRTGEHFMTLAKRGDVKNFCTPNAVLTFKEYLLDYASQETQQAGSKVINQYVQSITDTRPQQAQRLQQLLKRLEAGERDLYI